MDGVHWLSAQMKSLSLPPQKPFLAKRDLGAIISFAKAAGLGQLALCPVPNLSG